MLLLTGYFGCSCFRLTACREVSMPPRISSLHLVGGRLALNFVNSLRLSESSNLEEFVRFLQVAEVVSPERGAYLLNLPQTDPRTAETLLSRVGRLGAALRHIFFAMARKEKIAKEWIEPINEILRITEGHDELVLENAEWHLEFVAREGGLDWLLAAIARSAAEILVEGPAARVRVCANPDCGLLFSDVSRTRQRRWCSMARCGNRHKVAAFARRHDSRHRVI
jgi:predicted RNA-binding Zn ribbon-like protein